MLDRQIYSSKHYLSDSLKKSLFWLIFNCQNGTTFHFRELPTIHFCFCATQILLNKTHIQEL